MILKNGLFANSDGPVIPVGFNYWPSTTGTECWLEENWDIVKMEKDLKAIRKAGFNCIRFFLRWPEFQPEEEMLDESAFRRLEAFADCADSLGIWMNPSLFVGFMSGGLYVPDWVGGNFHTGTWWGGRNIFTDKGVIEAQKRLVARACKVFRKSGHFLAYDFGNEINVWHNRYPDAGPLDLIKWQTEIAAAMRENHPGCLVINGTQHDTVCGDSYWKLEDMPTDIFSMHGYPVTSWNHVRFDTLKEPESTMLIPFYTAMAAAWNKPVMLQEFGVALPVDGPVTEGYVRATAVSAMLNGAMGFLFWAWQDFECIGYPYDRNPFEQILGFADTEGRGKESGKGFLDALPILKCYGSWRPDAPEVAIYIPNNYFRGGNTTQYNISHFFCHFLLSRLHVCHEFTRTFDPKYKVVFIPGPGLWIDEAQACADYVARGGRIIASGIDVGFWGKDWNGLCGVHPVDMRLTEGKHLLQCMGFESEVELQGLDGYFPEFATGTAEIIGFLGGGIPAVIRNRVGKGQIICTVIPWERSLMRKPARLEAHTLYTRLLELLDFKNTARCSQPDVEIAVLNSPDMSRRVMVAVNHAWRDLRCSAELDGRTFTFETGRKNFTVMEL